MNLTAFDSRLLLEPTRGPPPDDQRPDDALIAQERQREQGSESGSLEDLPHGENGHLVDVRDLDRRPRRRRPADDRIVKAYRHLADRRHVLVGHAVGGAKPELLAGVVELVDRPGIGSGQLDRAGHDRGQHRLEIERGVDRLADLAERPQLLDRAGQLARGAPPSVRR